MTKHNAFIITGPTASGKSGFAHMLARQIGGTIINCDSVQIYRGIESIAASPFAGREITDEIDGVPYKLFSILPLAEQISVADYIKMAHTEYNKTLAGGRVPIFVGGTGYYINGIINGIAEIPEISPENRTRARQLVADDLARAKQMVPQISATDPQRVARALEVFLQTGRHLTEWWQEPRVGAIVPTPFRILINPPADILRERIATRIPEMISDGAMDEVQFMMDNNFDLHRAIGATQIAEFLNGNISRDAAIVEWTTKTNQYAKRQRTWFKTQFKSDLIIDRVPTANDLNLFL